MTPTDLRTFWRQVALKLAAALAVCVAVTGVLGQAPADPAAGASSFAVTPAVDGNGHRYLPLPAKYPNTPKGRNDILKVFNESIQRVLTGQVPLAQNQSAFTNYYLMYYFPFLTQTTEAELKALPQERQRFSRLHLELSAAKANPEVHKTITGLALRTMHEIVRDKAFHPAVRYNAMLLIGSLNDQEAVRTPPSSASPPVPMALALPIILAEFKRPENEDPIKVAALLGLIYHLQWDNEKPASAPKMAADLRKQVLDELLKLAQANETPPDRTPDGHVWFRRRAVEALSYAAAKTPDQAVVDALIALLKDDAQPLPLRCSVAAAMARVSFQQPVVIDVPAVAKELGYVALASVDAELTRALKYKKDEEEKAIRLAGGFPVDASMQIVGGPRQLQQQQMPGSPLAPGPGSGMDMYLPDPSLTDPTSYRVEYVRRKLRSILWSVQLGLTGGEDRDPARVAKTAFEAPPPSTVPGRSLVPTAGVWAKAAYGPEKDGVDKIYFSVRKLAELVEAKTFDLAKLDKDLRAEMKNLESLTRRLAPPPPPPSAPDAGPASPFVGAPRPVMPLAPRMPIGQPGFQGRPACF